MPVIKSVEKPLRQSKKRRARNLRYKTKIKDLTKKALSFVREKKREELAKLLPSLYKAVDKAAKVGVLKKNTAARRKARFAKAMRVMNPNAPTSSS